MAKIKTRFLFKTFFGNIPKTVQIETTEKDLKNEFENFLLVENSDELKEILDMEKQVNSKQFKAKLQSYKDDTFEKTDEFKKLQQFNQLKKAKAIKFYFKYRDTGKPERLTQIEKAEETDSKEYNKIKNSGKYKRFIDAEKSKELALYYKLEEFTKSKEFLVVKTEKEDTERYKQTDEYKLLQKYEAAISKENIKNYFSLKDTTKFDELKAYETTFFDDFEGSKLDSEKWINNYFWGKALMNEGYSLVTDKHFITNGKNIEVKNSVCKIVTRKEKAEGKSWDPRIGFYPRNFEYTSGLISTGESFRQKTGRFQAKVKLNSLSTVTNAFWMVSEKMLPQIDIFKTGNKNKISVSNHWGKKIQSSLGKFSGTKYTNDFFIFTLDWTPEKLTWKINDVVVKEETNGLPDDPMYIIFSSGLQQEVDNSALPSSMEIDWVRCLKKIK